jgi:predicted XRE-type DNA-binding protein
LCSSRTTLAISGFYAKQPLHAGLVIIIPNVNRAVQQRLFRGTLELASLGERAIASTSARANVFADPGFPNSDREVVKARLTAQISQILRDRKITQKEAARLLGTTQSHVSALKRCRPISVSIGKLMEFLTALGQDVEITVKPGVPDRAGHMSVTMQSN